MTRRRIVRYTEGDGITIQHRIKIPVDTRHTEELKRRMGMGDPRSRNTVEDTFFRYLHWARKTLKAAGLPYEAKDDDGFMALEPIVLEKGYRRSASPEWFAARFIEDVERITMMLNRISNPEADTVGYLAVHLGYMARQYDEKFGSDIERSTLAARGSRKGSLSKKPPRKSLELEEYFRQRRRNPDLTCEGLIEEMKTWEEDDQEEFQNLEMWWDRGDECLVVHDGRRERRLKPSSLARYWENSSS